MSEQTVLIYKHPNDDTMQLSALVQLNGFTPVVADRELEAGQQATKLAGVIFTESCTSLEIEKVKRLTGIRNPNILDLRFSKNYNNFFDTVRGHH